jgi:hypothetical protein
MITRKSGTFSPLGEWWVDNSVGVRIDRLSANSESRLQDSDVSRRPHDSGVDQVVILLAYPDAGFVTE